MKGITVKRLTKSNRFAGKTRDTAAAPRSSQKTVVYTVSRLTKPWAVEGAKSAIRALSGNALNAVEIQVKINDPKPAARKRTAAHVVAARP